MPRNLPLDALCAPESPVEPDPRSSAEVVEDLEADAFERRQDAHRCATCAVERLGDDCPDCLGGGHPIDDDEREELLARRRFDRLGADREHFRW